MSQIFSQKSQIIAGYENINLMRKEKVAKTQTSVFSTMDFPQIGAQDWIFKSRDLDFLQILTQC